MTRIALLAGAALVFVSTQASAGGLFGGKNDQSSAQKQQAQGEAEIPQCSLRNRRLEPKQWPQAKQRNFWLSQHPDPLLQSALERVVHRLGSRRQCPTGKGRGDDLAFALTKGLRCSGPWARTRKA